MEDLLYGTYLTYRVKEVMTQASGAMTIREIAAVLAQLPKRQQDNLCRRVAHSLESLQDRGEAERTGTQRKNNFIAFTYSIKSNTNCNARSIERTHTEHEPRQHGDGDARGLPATD